MPVVIAVVIAIAILFYFGRLASKRGREMREKAKAELSSKASTATPAVDLAAPKRPSVASVSVEGETATVIFDVPLPDGEVDEVMVDLLTSEAVEVVREHGHSASIEAVTEVVARAGRPVSREVGRRSLEYPGQLPPSLGFGHLLQFHKFGVDPIEGQFDAGTTYLPPSTVTGSDELAPIGNELHLPKAVEVGLRSHGLDPSTMHAGEFVRTTLELYGYELEALPAPNTYVATKAGMRTFISEHPHGPGDHPELDEAAVTQFAFEFSSSKADRGLLVTEKWGPYEIYDREKREPRIRFVTRERLQGFVDALALG